MPQPKQGSKSSRSSQADRDAALKQSLAGLRDLLSSGVVLTAQRIQESMDEAVSRGRMTRQDAEELVVGLVDSGRQQTTDLLADLEQLLGRSRGDRHSAAGRAAERVAQEVDRARRAIAPSPVFPIADYDTLTVKEITARVKDLDAAQLAQVREHEEAGRKRKGVLTALDRAAT